MNLKPAIKLIKEFEGFRAKAYRCPAGVWTVGYGTTKGVIRGREVSKAEAEKLLEQDILEERVPVIRDKVDVPLTNNELCALISFVYNVGNGAFARSTLLRKLNGGFTRAQVAEEFKKWNKGGGKVLAGLVRRRTAERELFLTPDRKEVSTNLI